MNFSLRFFTAFSRALVTAAILGATIGRAADIYWDGNTGDWTTLTAWSTDATGTTDPANLPGALDTARFNITGQNANQSITVGGNQSAQGLNFSSTGTTTITGTSGTDDLTLGTGGITLNTGAGAVNMDALTIFTVNGTALNIAAGTSLSFSGNIRTTTTSGDVNLLKSGLGTVCINGSQMFATGSSPNRIFNITQGRVNFTNATVYLSSLIAQTNNNAYLTSTNTAFNVNDSGWNHGGLILGWGNGFYSFAINGGSFTMPGRGVQMMGSGNTGRALLSLDGGATMISPYFIVANNDNCVGVLNVRDATITNGGTFRLGASKAIGIVNHFGGIIDNSGDLNLDYRMNQNNNWGIYNLRGGQLKTVRITTGDSTANFRGSHHAFFNFHGGILSPKVGSTNFVLSTITGASAGTVSAPQLIVYSDGAVIDTLGMNITINEPLKAPLGHGVSGGTIPISAANQGSGYRGEPVVRPELSPGNLTNVTATAIANMVDDGTGNGTFKIASITITNPGVNYSSTDTVSLNIYGGDPTTPATPPALTLAPNVSGALTKKGAGSLTLTAANTYAGDTNIEEGVVSLSQPNLNNEASSVSMASDAKLDLNFDESAGDVSDTVDKLFIGGISKPAGVYGATGSGATITDDDHFTGIGTLTVTTGGPTPYSLWAASKGLTGDPGFENGHYNDPDNDGKSNLFEFAFNGNPLQGADRGYIFALVEDSDFDMDTTKELILTVAVRNGTNPFGGVGFPSAQHDGIRYKIRGVSNGDLADFPDGSVAPVPSPITTGLPSLLESGYEYRSFTLKGSNGLPNKGFMRAEVEIP